MKDLSRPLLAATVDRRASTSLYPDKCRASHRRFAL
jgi:hypothetical protein